MEEQVLVYNFFSTIMQRVGISEYCFHMPFDNYIVSLHDDVYVNQIGSTRRPLKKYELIFYAERQGMWHKIEVTDSNNGYFISTPLGYAEYTDLEYSTLEPLITRLVANINTVTHTQTKGVTRVMTCFNAIVSNLLFKYNISYVYKSRNYNGEMSIKGKMEIDGNIHDFVLTYTIVYSHFVFTLDGQEVYTLPFKIYDDLWKLGKASKTITLDVLYKKQ